MIAIAPQLLKWSQVAWDEVQRKKAFGDQFSMAFSCYVDITNVKIWNLFVASSWTHTQINLKLGMPFQTAKSLYEAFSHMTVENIQSLIISAIEIQYQLNVQFPQIYDANFKAPS